MCFGGGGSSPSYTTSPDAATNRVDREGGKLHDIDKLQQPETTVIDKNAPRQPLGSTTIADQYSK